jgi:hypothetical protein
MSKIPLKRMRKKYKQEGRRLSSEATELKKIFYSTLVRSKLIRLFGYCRLEFIYDLKKVYSSPTSFNIKRVLWEKS